MDEENFNGKKIGKYQLKGNIGEGAFSTVYLAEEIGPTVPRPEKNNNHKKEKLKISIFAHRNAKHTSISSLSSSSDSQRDFQSESEHNKYFACKIIPRKKVENKKLSTRLEQEIRIHRVMHHPNVVQLVDVLKDPNFFYVFLEFCPCGELFEYVVDRTKLKEHEAAVFFKQLLIGLQYIHSMNVAHRDMKPENILLDQFGRIKISDFGLSKCLDNQSNGLTKTPCGSPCYASPECISGHSYDPRKSDVWSCGVILYAITTGQLPWTKRNQSKMFQQIKRGEYQVPVYLSDNCADLIRRLMTVDNTKRITIEEALQHPFLKDITVPVTTLDPKYVSLRKVDRFFGADKNFHIDSIIQSEVNGKIGASAQFDGNLFKLRKDLVTEEEKQKKKEHIEELSTIIKARQKNLKELSNEDRKACQLLVRVDSKMNITLNSSSDGDDSEDKVNNNDDKQKLKKLEKEKTDAQKDNNEKPPKSKALIPIPRQDVGRKNLNWKNQFYGMPQLVERRSQRMPQRLIF